jgi:hypothetical protein
VSDLPPGLKDFGERLERAAQRGVDERRCGAAPPRRRPRWLRSIGLPVLAGLVAGAVSAGAVRIGDREGGPIERDAPARKAPTDLAVVLATATDDPVGGPPWVVRPYTDAGGRECAQVGRLREGVFGQVQRGRFRPLPATATGSCHRAGAATPLIAVDRHGPVGLTLVFGLAVDRTTVTVRMGAEVQRVNPGGFGAFLTIFDSARPGTRVFVTSKVGGRTRVDNLR